MLRDGERGKDERRGAERPPRIVGCRVAAREPESAEQRRAGRVDPGDPVAGRLGQQPSPRGGRDREPIRPAGLERPRPPDPDDRAIGRGLQPERRFEVERAGRGEQAIGSIRSIGSVVQVRVAAAGGAGVGRSRRESAAIPPRRRSSRGVGDGHRSSAERRRSAPRRRRRFEGAGRAASGRPFRVARDRR